MPVVVFLDIVFNLLAIFLNSHLFGFLFPLLMAFFIVFLALYTVRYLISLRK